MQKVILELKMLSMVARRTEQPAPRRDAALETALRAEIAQLEARIDQRLESHLQDVAASHRDTAGTLTGLRGELGRIASQLDAAQQHSARSQQEIQAAGEKIISHVQQHLDASAERVQRLEQKLAASQDRVQKLADSALNYQHLEKIGSTWKLTRAACNKSRRRSPPPMALWKSSIAMLSAAINWKR